MPSIIITLSFGIIIGFAISQLIRKPQTKQELGKKESNKEKIISYLKENKKITNDQVEELIGVGDTSAYNYLEELEKEGLIEQIGKTGKYTYYRLKF